jgi:hypothetical protein
MIGIRTLITSSGTAVPLPTAGSRKDNPAIPRAGAATRKRPTTNPAHLSHLASTAADTRQDTPND